MSKIVIDARELRTSSGRYVERLLNYLQELDKDNEYVVLVKPADLGSWQSKAPNFEAVSCRYKEFTFGEQLGLKWQIKKQRADLVHFTFAQQPILYKGKTVTTIHDLTTLRFDNPSKNKLIFKIKQRIYGQVIKRAVHKSVTALTGSEFVKNDLAKFAGINPDKVIVTHEAADPITDQPEPLPGLVGKSFLMYVGRPMPHKNLERLIEAFVSLRAQHPQLTLVLAGQKDANYERIESDVNRRAIRGVFFAGKVSEGRLRWLYENCAAYVFPSLSEGFGLPGLEAMIHGAPVVSSNATCLPEVYGEAAHYFDPLDTEAMAKAINEVLTNEELRDDLIAKGRKQAAQYSWRRMAEQTLAVYQKALKP